MFPDPPWTQAPSEVMAWGASVGGRYPRAPRFHRPTRVRGYAIDIPASQKPRLLARMRRLGFEAAGGGSPRLYGLANRLAHHAAPEEFEGRFGSGRIGIRLRKGTRIEVRASFTPQMMFRRAWRVISRLGLDPARGTWL